MTKKQHWQNSKRLKGMKDEMLKMNRMLYDLVNGQKMNEFDWLVHQVYEIEYRLYRQPIKRVHHHPFDCQVSIVRIHSSEKTSGFWCDRYPYTNRDHASITAYTKLTLSLSLASMVSTLPAFPDRTIFFIL